MTKRERERLIATPRAKHLVDPDEALDWLGSLAKLWRETSDEGRRQLALGLFEQIEVVSSHERGTHRIVKVEMSSHSPPP